MRSGLLSTLRRLWPRAAEPTTAAVYRCPLCGRAFTAEEAACDACPLARRCGLVMCPACGHEFPQA